MLNYMDFYNAHLEKMEGIYRKILHGGEVSEEEFELACKDYMDRRRRRGEAPLVDVDVKETLIGIASYLRGTRRPFWRLKE